MQSAFAAFVLFAAVVAAPAATPVKPAIPPLRSAPPPTLGTALRAAGFGAPLQSRLGFTPLQGLPSAGDPTPQCRSTCVKNRAVCGDDAECGDQWRQCVTACAARPK